MSLRVLEPGFITTIQDLGRSGYEALGVPVSGAMDWFALAAANALVGNPWNEAALEMAVLGPKLQAVEAGVLAATGSGFAVKVQGRSLPLWTAFYVRSGDTVELISQPQGCWGYLAAAGGFEAPPVLGSRSTYLYGGFGGLSGRKIEAQDLLQVGNMERAWQDLAGRSLPEEVRPDYGEAVSVEVILGPQKEAFTEEGLETFLSAEYRVSGTSDRMGYRLEGPAVEHASSADLISEGLVFGSVQVPASGQPIVMMADRQTTGGYPKIATVTRTSLPVLAQCPPGLGRVRFRETSVEAAQEKYRDYLSVLRGSIADPDEYDLGYSQF